MSKLDRSKKIIIGIVLAMVIGVGVWFAYSMLNPTYQIKGVFIDADNGLPVQDVVLKTGDNETKTGQDGQYIIEKVAKDTVVEVVVPNVYQNVDSAIDYDSASKKSWNAKSIEKDFSLQITEEEKEKRLLADMDVIYNGFKFAKWGDIYDAMSSASQERISKDDYIAKMEKIMDGITITDYTFENVKFLDKWTFESNQKEYEGVAEVDVSITAQTLGISQVINQVTHYVKEDGSWKWFFAGDSDS